MKRFWSKVDTSGGPDACWPWTAALNRGGYGKFQLRTRTTKSAHRVALALASNRLDMLENTAVGSVGEVVMHTCDNRPCCNPAHLRLGTQGDNMRDAHIKGRGATHNGARWDRRGSNNPHSKMTDEQRAYVAASTEPAKQVAERFGISWVRVYQLRRAHAARQA